MNLIGRTPNGLGIASAVVLMNLMQTLEKNGTLAHGDTARILSVSDAQIALWGESNMAVKDARTVLDKLRGLGS